MNRIYGMLSLDIKDLNLRNIYLITFVLVTLMSSRMPPQKHIVDSGITSNSSTSQTSLLLAKGVINPDPYTTNTDCRAGSIIGDMALMLDIVQDNSVNGTPLGPMYIDWGVFYNINDQQTPPTLDNPMGSAGADLLNQLFHVDQCFIYFPVSAGDVTAPQPRSWRVQIGIPKSFRKIMRGDTIRFYYKSSSSGKFWIKVRVIYKEYWP